MLLEQAWKSGGTFLQGLLGTGAGATTEAATAGLTSVGSSFGAEAAFIPGAVQGAVFGARGIITMMAQGGQGVVTAPTYVPMANGGTAMIGEAGVRRSCP